MAEIRLQKFLAEAGIASRRQAEKLIKQGRVDVNGVMAVIGQKVDPGRDRVMVDGEGVRRAKAHLYVAMNKPRGYICTADDPEGRPTVYDLLPPLASPVHSVGRLDFNSEGLLLFTNDGDLTRALTRPAAGVPRVYEVKVQGKVPGWAVEKLLRGVPVGKSKGRFERCERLRDTDTNVWMEVMIRRGRNREVRRMFDALGMNVLKLKRVSFGPVTLGRMKTGSARELTEAEVGDLRKCTEGRNGCSPPPPSGRRSRLPDPPRNSGGRGSRRSRA